MSFFIARRNISLSNSAWSVARNVIYPSFSDAKYAIIADFGIWKLISGEYRVADCDHYPDKYYWVNQ